MGYTKKDYLKNNLEKTWQSGKNTVTQQGLGTKNLQQNDSIKRHNLKRMTEFGSNIEVKFNSYG